MHLALDFLSIAGTEILFSATFFPSSLRFALNLVKGQVHNTYIGARTRTSHRSIFFFSCGPPLNTKS